ncbi:8-amino-7-oxononanoate synthase [Methylopila jiangsuensis]|uniref:8-amino-7-oxononanoate synthase n=1 Tax=Methylopila jiangsuensis TaxID=586230 RepID=A0A9W6N5H2_9HYPH|nr:8-amino-7-oxononanoate synthase [Methylopila jiangsuensis]MDR6284393.1 8-amino-7-oxononanoate synthase [Methylopila jiangsuensis]GLK78222.1 8-amino-7-oxononanoate synthase [Methylopila jiangsuensis]
MSADRLARFEATLAGLARRSQRRRLIGRAGHDFASNDYLGLAAAPRLQAAIGEALARGVPVGAAGSRLLRGNDPEHEALEAEAAAFFRSEAALYFGAGYSANVALLSALPQRGDLVVYDALVHASVHEGLRLTKAETVAVPHNDAGAVGDAIRRWREGGGRGAPWIAAESVYSMDGDRAPVSDLLALAEVHDGFLLLDEAHATGVLGPTGRGLAEAFEGREALIATHTCGKALGASGALVTGPRVIVDYLINRAKPFIYATAPSPLAAGAVREALRIVDDEPERRDALQRRVAIAKARLEALGFAASDTAIQPVILGPNARAVEAAEALQAAGFDCRAVRPPTVPEGTARLRISLTLNVEEATVSALMDALAETLTAAAA